MYIPTKPPHKVGAAFLVRRKMLAITERPELTFDIFRADARATVIAASQIQRLFGKENFDEFREAGKSQISIPAEARMRVDRQVYAFVEEVFHVRNGANLWETAISRSVDTLNYARGILFPDQERQASLTTNIAWDPGRRPSTVLERLTLPRRLIGEQFKYEQGRQLGLAFLCAEVLSRDDNGNSREVLTRVNDFLESKLFMGRKGDPQKYHTFSFHTPLTNRLIGLSTLFPDHNFGEALWVKSLDYPVRRMGVRDATGELTDIAQVLYDPREKDLESTVIKAKQRSLKWANGQSNGVIETSPHFRDQLGFRLVIMDGGELLRNRITANLERLFAGLEGFVAIEADNDVDPHNGSMDRVRFQRRQLFIEGLKNPLEVIVQTLPDYISHLYEIGIFDPEKGMHNGPAHDLYKLMMVADIAAYLWPERIYGIDLRRFKQDTSFDFARRLGTKQRIYPSTHIEG